MIMSDRAKSGALGYSKKTAQSYSLCGPTKCGTAIRTKQERTIIDCITRDLKEGGRILEVGTGRGEFAELVKIRGFRYVGIEPSTQMRKALLERGFEILEDPVPTIKLEDESVDLVHSNAVIEHLNDYSTVLNYFGEAWRVLKPGGLITSVVPNCDSIGMIFYLYDYQHNFVTTGGRLEHLLRDTGFEVVSSRCFLTRLGLTPLRLIDRVTAHFLLFFMRSPLVYSLVRVLFGDRLSLGIYKNLYDQILVIGRKHGDPK